MRKFVTTVLLAGFMLAAIFTRVVSAAPQAASQPAYTIPEYNAFQAANTEKDPQTKIKDLDDFVSKYPMSTLLQYVYQLYYQTYAQLKNPAKVIEYADKLVTLGEKADLGARLQALQARVQAFGQLPTNPPPDTDSLTKEHDAAMQGANLLEMFPKPANSKMSDADFANQKKPGIAFFYSAAAAASLQMKDNAGAIQALKMALMNNPNDAVSDYRLGLAYLAMAPPQALDGFWALARAIDLKINESDKVKDYLRSRMLAYEQPGCDSQIDMQLSQLLQLAMNAPDRPQTYMLPSADDLNKIRQASNILTVVMDLSGGGDKAQMTWLALCGAEFPEVVGKIISVNPGDGFVDIMAYTGPTPEDMQAATTANMDVKVWTTGTPPPAPAAPAGTTPTTVATPNPDAVRLQKDQGIRFAGALASYDPSPFMLHWDMVKVDPSVIPPAEKGSHRK